jgi:leader peptidase (prepilin peptidase)/N-methyltransferase
LRVENFNFQLSTFNSQFETLRREPTMTLQIQITIFAFVLGAVMGSFGNVLIHRLPKGQSIVSPGSRCPSCGAPVRWFDNVPILSYAVLRARCRACGAPISALYPLVEALTGLLFAGLVWRVGIQAAAVPLAILCWALVVVSFIDLGHRIIPDAISLPGIALGLAASFLPGFPRPVDSLIGAAAGGGFLFVILFTYEKIMKDEGMGMGDVKLLAMIGAFLGWQALPVTILVASLTGTLAGVGFALARSEPVRKFPVPFGPFLALGAVVHLFFGVEMILWYLGKLS